MHTISCWRPHWARDPWLAAWRDQVPGPERADWPQQAGFDELLAEARLRGRAVPAALRFSVGLEPPDYYECHIAATGEVPTRPHNWHDWFNALAWLVWPRLKGALNRRHLWAMQAQGEVRRGQDLQRGDRAAEDADFEAQVRGDTGGHRVEDRSGVIART